MDRREAAQKVAAKIHDQHKKLGKPISTREAEKKAMRVAQNSDNRNRK